MLEVDEQSPVQHNTCQGLFRLPGVGEVLHRLQRQQGSDVLVWSLHQVARFGGETDRRLAQRDLVRLRQLPRRLELRLPLRLSQRHARPDERPLDRAEILLPGSEPRLRLCQWHPAQQRPLILACALPRPHGDPQSLLPGAEEAVLRHPPLQPAPAADQRLVHHLHRLATGQRIARGDHQPLIGEALHQAPRVLPHVGPHRHAARVLRALTRLDELGEDAASERLLLITECTDHLVGVARQRPHHPPDRLIRRVRQPAEVQPLPQEHQRELQERQVARLPAHIVQQPLDEARLERCPLQLPGLLDRRPQLLSRHRAQHLSGCLQGIRQRSVCQRLSHEVGPQRQQQHEVRCPVTGALGSACGRKQRVDEPLPCRRVGAQRVQLLELVHHQQQAPVVAPSAPDPAHHIPEGQLAASQRLTQPPRLQQPLQPTQLRLELRQQRPGECLERLAPGPQVGDHPAALGAQPREQSRVDHRRLPRPRRTHHRRDGGGHDTGLKPLDERLAPEEEARVGLAEGCQPAVGARPHPA